MTTSTRFAVAVHVLVGLTLEGGPVPSERLAESVGTHPSVIRRILMSLANAGLTTSQRGAGGGALLARPPERISLLEIYRAVETPGFVATHECCESSGCAVAANILPALRCITSRAEGAFQAELGDATVADVAADVAARASGGCADAEGESEVAESGAEGIAIG